eukprot:403336521
MESTKPSTAKSTAQAVISQNLTIEELKKKTKPKDLDVKIYTALGTGAFGTVYLVDLYKRVKEKVAMKVVRKECRGVYQQIDQKDLVEIEIMNQISNPYLNKLIDYYFQVDKDSQQEELVLLQPLAMCDMQQFLQKNYPDGGMPEKQAIEFLAQLAIGVKAMHDNKVIHRDLNPKNILVFKNENYTSLNNQEYILRISDFGCSRILQINEEEARTRVGKENYMPSEQNSGTGYNANVDVYALGVTVFQMITGKVINAGIISSKKIDLQCYSPEFIDFLYKLCSLDHEKRPSIDEVINDPIIQKSQTFLNCLLDGIIPMNSTKIERAIDGFKLLQKEYEAQEQFIDDLQKKFPISALQERIKRPLKNTLPEIGKMFHLMNKVQKQFKDQDDLWQAQYQLAFGNNEQQYLMEKYLNDVNNQNLESLRELKECKFKKEVDENGDIFVGFYKQECMQGQDTIYSKYYGRFYEQNWITEGYLTNGKFNGDTSENGINTYGNNYYYDGDYVDGLYNGYGVYIFSSGAMFCGEYKNGNRHGLGTYYYNDGDSYEGQWMNSCYHGEGVFKYTNGDILKGTWKDDKYHGEFIKTYASGKQEKITYDMGKEISREEVKSI